MTRNYFQTVVTLSLLIIGLATFVFIQTKNFQQGLIKLEPLYIEISNLTTDNFETKAEAKDKLELIHVVHDSAFSFYQNLIEANLSLSYFLVFIALVQAVFLYQLYRTNKNQNV